MACPPPDTTDFHPIKPEDICIDGEVKEDDEDEKDDEDGPFAAAILAFKVKKKSQALRDVERMRALRARPSEQILTLLLHFGFPATSPEGALGSCFFLAALKMVRWQ